MNGRDGTAAFLPLNTKIGGQVNDNRSSVGQCSTLLIKLKFICNAAIIDMVNNGTENHDI